MIVIKTSKHQYLFFAQNDVFVQNIFFLFFSEILDSLNERHLQLEELVDPDLTQEVLVLEVLALTQVDLASEVLVPTQVVLVLGVLGLIQVVQDHTLAVQV